MATVKAGQVKSQTVAVTGLGMISSIGHDIVTSCASARAGITRISEMHGLRIVDPDTGDVEQALGHTVAGVTDGFSDLGRLVRLGVAGIKDLIMYSGLNAWENIGLFINLSSGFYQIEREKALLIEMDEWRGEADQAEILSAMRERNQYYEESLIPSILESGNIPLDPAHGRTFFRDHTGFIQAIRAATNSLETNEFKRCIIGGIDSYVDSASLEAINDVGLLKTRSREAGFIPGESAAFVLIEREDTVRRRKGNVHGLIQSWNMQTEPFNRLSDKPAMGIALSEAISETLEHLDDKGRRTGLIIGALNGDPSRASDWGCALVRLRANYPWMDVPEWYPALSFGEIGAAIGPAAVCMACRGFTGEYARTENVLIWLSDDNGARGSFYMRKYSS